MEILREFFFQELNTKRFSLLCSVIRESSNRYLWNSKALNNCGDEMWELKSSRRVYDLGST